MYYPFISAADIIGLEMYAGAMVGDPMNWQDMAYAQDCKCPGTRHVLDAIQRILRHVIRSTYARWYTKVIVNTFLRDTGIGGSSIVTVLTER